MTEPRDQSSAEICDAATLADKIAAWSPSSRCPLVFIARERRLIEDALRTFSVAQPLNQQAKDHPPLDNPRDPFASPDRITGGAQPARDLSSDQIMEILRRTVQGELLALLTVGRRQGLGADVRIPSMSAEVLAREFIAAAQSAPALTASHNSGERAPSSDAARAGAGTQCSAATEDEMGVIESDRLFAEQIIADFGSFEEGITDQEKLAQWIRNIRRACSTPDEPQSSGWQPIETAPKDGTSILVCHDDTIVSEAEFDIQDDGWWLAQTGPHDFDPSNAIYPTLWQPMPTPPLSRPHGEIEDCDCIGAVIGQHDRSCPLASHQRSGEIS